MISKSRIPLQIACLLLLAVIAGSCSSDPCELDCGTGECLEGECVCDSLHEGDLCELLATEKFLGAWTTGEICNSNSDVHESIVQAGNSEGQLTIDAFGPDRLPVGARVSGQDLIIPIQAYGQATIEGSGGFGTDSTFITLEYLVDYGGGVLKNCIGTLER